MRKIGFIIWFLLAGIIISCNDFLDVKADNEIVESEIYGHYSGVRMAVNGVYKTISTTSLYGKNLTWGFASAVGHNYMATSTSYLPTALYYASQFNWENSYVEDVTDQIWKTAYNAIATCNNIIRHVSEKDTTFFELGKVEKNMILGEMYGLRGMLHFDLYRLFCPAPVTNYAGTAIPYVQKYPDYQPEHKNAKAVMDSIIVDLERSQSLLAHVDTVFCRSWCTSLTARIRHTGSWTTSPPNEFMSYRTSRMNYWGVTGLLARVHMYNGNLEKAYENARINYYFHTKWYTWTAASNSGSSTSLDLMHPKRPTEIMLCFSNSNNYDNWESALGTSTTMMRMKNIDHLFTNDADDYRLVGWYNRYNDQRYLTWVRPLSTAYSAKQTADNQGPLLPIISFPEMYHIMIECLIEKGKTAEALELLSALRLKRGAKRTLSETMHADELKEILINDIIRETLTSGQTFFMFKRLNRNIYNGSTDITMEPQNWIVPIPQSEAAYQFN